MRRIRTMFCVAALTAATACAGVAQQANPTTNESVKLAQDVDILSDTQGVNFQPFLQNILSAIHARWASLIPADAQQGSTEIRLSIKPDGTVSAMRMDGSSNDDALNRAAWGSLTGMGQLPPLPAKFHGPDLEMRIHFVVNE